MTAPADSEAEALDRTDEGPAMDEHWRELVTAALLGTDRRDPPPPAGQLADLVADTARAAPSERMLAQIAACTAVRRAAFVPAPPQPPLAPPESDDRPVCPPGVADRWGHISTSWPVLEDEWALLLIANGWRLVPELVPPLLRRHRRDPLRRARVMAAAGPLAAWLVDLVPDLEGTGAAGRVDPEAVGLLPDLPISPELAILLDAPPDDAARAVVAGVAAGRFGRAHRAVLVNLIARVGPATLAPLAARLEAIDSANPSYPLAQSLADLASTRQRMRVELESGSSS